MFVDDFDFDLPPSLIALRPAVPRDAGRLLEVDSVRGLAGHHVHDLPNLFRRGDLLVFNDTKVLRAEITATRSARSVNERDIDVSLTLLQPFADGCWTAFAKPGRRLKVGTWLHIGDPDQFSLTVVSKKDDGQVVVQPVRGSIEGMMAQYGRMPLPSYIAKSRPVDERDTEDYQTLFAVHEGAVAAPTAGLHFTPHLMEALDAAGVGTAFITLHVGAGTFLPVKANRVDDHIMHEERFEIGGEAAGRINATRARGGRVIAVGTTSLRAMESAIDGYGKIRAGSDATRLFLKPGDKVRSADMLMTNFHLPKSTLFMLVCAFAGTAVMKSAYAHAIAEGFRFYSYGDACLLHRA